MKRSAPTPVGPVGHQVRLKGQNTPVDVQGRTGTKREINQNAAFKPEVLEGHCGRWSVGRKRTRTRTRKRQAGSSASVSGDLHQRSFYSLLIVQPKRWVENVAASQTV